MGRNAGFLRQNNACTEHQKYLRDLRAGDAIERGAGLVGTWVYGTQYAAAAAAAAGKGQHGCWNARLQILDELSERISSPQIAALRASCV